MRAGLVHELRRAGVPVAPGVSPPRSSSRPSQAVLIADPGSLPSAGMRTQPPRTVEFRLTLSPTGRRPPHETSIQTLLAEVLGPGFHAPRAWQPPGVGPVPLTAREEAVMRLLAAGSTAAEAAAEMGVSARTVHAYKRSAVQKMGAGTMADAMTLKARHPGADSEASSKHAATVHSLDATAASLVAAALRSVDQVAHADPLGSNDGSDVGVLVGLDHGLLQRFVDQQLPVVLLDDCSYSDDHLAELARRGVHAVLDLHSTTAEELSSAVTALRAGSTLLSPRVARLAIDAQRTTAGTTKLSPRESEVLQLIASSHSTKQIARQLGISARTVENTQRLLYSKLGVRNRVQAVATAHSNGLLRPKQVREANE